MDYPSSLKGLAAIAVLKSKIFISPQEIPPTLYEDLQNLNFLVKLKKEELELEREMENVKEILAQGGRITGNLGTRFRRNLKVSHDCKFRTFGAKM